MMAAVSPVILKTYILRSYLSTSFLQFNLMVTEVLDICDGYLAVSYHRECQSSKFFINNTVFVLLIADSTHKMMCNLQQLSSSYLTSVEYHL